MQTEAAPREPFTVGILFRYKFTIFAVAVFVILGGYVRIITQPKLYEATARLAVRFSGENLALGQGQERSFRLPLLEEEVKAYTGLLTDRRTIEQVLEDLPRDAPPGNADSQREPEVSPAQQFRSSFLSAYYGIRKAIGSAVDVLLFNTDVIVTDREQRVNQILSRMTVTAGEEASHIITVSYQNPSPSLAAKLVNALSKKFIELQRRRVKKRDEAKAATALAEAVAELEQNRKQHNDLATELQSPSIEEFIRRHYLLLDQLRQQKSRFEIAKALLDEDVVPYDKDLPLESPRIRSEMERTGLEFQMRYEQGIREFPEKTQLVWAPLLKLPALYLAELRKQALENDKKVVTREIAALDAQVEKLVKDERLVRLAPLFTQLSVAQERIQKKIQQAEIELQEVHTFNMGLEDENVAENVALWQPAIIPPFPVPQHRELKFVVVMALGLFAGCAAALMRHQVKPRPIRRPRPRSEAEAHVPIVILPDDHKSAERSLDIDIAFPGEDAAAGKRGVESKK